MATNNVPILDPSSPAGAIIFPVIAGVALVVVLGAAGWLLGPIRWIRENRRLRRLLVPNRRFRMIFNPTGPQNKFVTFEANGQIGEGSNPNESSWRIKRGRLEIFSSDGGIYSRFRHDRQTGRLVHTNDDDCRSILGQYFEPQWQRILHNSPNQLQATAEAAPDLGRSVQTYEDVTHTHCSSPCRTSGVGRR